jgi:hypothetical protein
MRRLLLAGAMLLALLVPASSALAAPHHPKPPYEQFNDCPLSHPSVDVCLYSLSSSGSFTIGKKTVPLKNPVVLQGGIEFTESIFDPNLTFVAAEDGNTLVPTPQPVPGGLLGITAPTWWPVFLQNLFNETINNGFTGVNATVELAKPASAIKLSVFNLLFQSGTALSLPAKIHLENPFLGSSCYIGSSSNPVTFNFTTGTTSPPPPNKPITGSPGEGKEEAGGTIITFTGGRLVDNAFAAPGANGCGGLFSFLIDPFVNSIVGVPSPAGTNTAILEGKIQTGEPAAIKASE